MIEQIAERLVHALDQGGECLRLGDFPLFL
jgi:hypothetical protein